MSRGFVILATDRKSRAAATVCAYSIKISNKDAQVSMIVPSFRSVEKAFEEPFDSIVELPFDFSETRRANDWQLLWASPYEHTIAIDAFSLVPRNMSSVFDYLCEHQDIAFSTVPMNFKRQYRSLKTDAYDTHNLEYVNSNMFYFNKKSDICLSYFKLADPFMRSWRDIFSNGLEPEYVPTEYNSDLMHSIILQGLGNDEIVNDIGYDILNMIDMRTANKEFYRRIESSWTEYLNVWMSKSVKLKIQNFAITDPIFYADAIFLTDEIYNGYRDYFRLTRKQETLVG